MNGYVKAVTRDNKLWIYSDKFTGAVVEFKHKPLDKYDSKNLRETLHQTGDIENYLKETVNYDKLRIFYNPDEQRYDLKHKDNRLQIQVDDTELYQMPVFEWDNIYGDINVIIDKDEDALFLKIGPQIYDQLLNLELSNKVNINTNQKTLEFWITKKDQPHILLDTIKVDTKRFIEEGQATFDISKVQSYVNYNEISVFTQRIFADYKIFYKNQFSAILDHQHTKYDIEVVAQEKYADVAIWLDSVENDFRTNTWSSRFNIMSSIKNFAKYDILSDYLDFYVVDKNNVHNMIQQVHIPILEIKNDRVFTFWVNTDRDVLFLHNHHKVLVGIQ
jgi:hypothetical protein